MSNPYEVAPHSYEDTSAQGAAPPPPPGHVGSWHPNTPVTPADADHALRASPLLRRARDTFLEIAESSARTLALRPALRPVINSPKASRVANPVDLRNLDYTTDPDVNLVCPICRAPMVDPVSTRCEHVFCRECFDSAFKNAPICPIDRAIVDVETVRPAHKIILNQLDNLEAKCPKFSLGCKQVMARSMIQDHVDKYCGYTMVKCADKSCDFKIYRKDHGPECMHWYDTCPDCDESIMATRMEDHRKNECAARKTNCVNCGEDIIRCLSDDHDTQCPDAIVHCKWALFGCEFEAARKDLPDHATKCVFKVIGPVVDVMKQEITTLRSEVKTLNERGNAQHRRILFLEQDNTVQAMESSQHPYMQELRSSIDYDDGSLDGRDTHDARHQYLLSLVESQDIKVQGVLTGMADLEAKQTMMLFNETIPIKEQLADLRSAQGVLGMHVRWLMNFRMQERRPGGSAGPNNEPKPGSGHDGSSGFSSGGSGLQPRRLSDTLRENITKL